MVYLNGKIYVDGRYQTFVLDAPAPAPARVILNGEVLAFETPPQVICDRTMLPVRFFFEKLGAQVQWKEETQEITVTDGEQVITFRIGGETALVNGEEKPLDAPAVLSGEKAMLPLRALAEQLGYQVDWEEDRKLVTVRRPAPAAEEP